MSQVGERQSEAAAASTVGEAERLGRDPSPFDAVELEILWQSLISTVNEQARALQRAAFSPIVREAGDLANAVFDRRGRMVAQAVTGTPGHINSLAIGAVTHATGSQRIGIAMSLVFVITGLLLLLRVKHDGH